LRSSASSRPTACTADRVRPSGCWRDEWAVWGGPGGQGQPHTLKAAVLVPARPDACVTGVSLRMVRCSLACTSITAAAHHALNTRTHERGARCAILHCTPAVHHTCWPLAYTRHTFRQCCSLPSCSFIRSEEVRRCNDLEPLPTSHESRPSPPPPPLEHRTPAGREGGRKRNRVRRQRASMDCCRGRHPAPSCDRLQRLQSTRPQQTNSLHRSEGTLHHC
jgi:hypothetical protein